MCKRKRKGKKKKTQTKKQKEKKKKIGIVRPPSNCQMRVVEATPKWFEGGLTTPIWSD
jgi:hypothetical protein